MAVGEFGGNLPGRDYTCARDRAAEEQASADEDLFPVAPAIVEERGRFLLTLRVKVEVGEVGAVVGSWAGSWAGVSGDEGGGIVEGEGGDGGEACREE